MVEIGYVLYQSLPCNICMKIYNIFHHELGRSWTLVQMIRSTLANINQINKFQSFYIHPFNNYERKSTYFGCFSC